VKFSILILAVFCSSLALAANRTVRPAQFDSKLLVGTYQSYICRDGGYTFSAPYMATVAITAPSESEVHMEYLQNGGSVPIWNFVKLNQNSYGGPVDTSGICIAASGTAGRLAMTIKDGVFARDRVTLSNRGQTYWQESDHVLTLTPEGVRMQVTLRDSQSRDESHQVCYFRKL
jgi:hypothetical protein